MIIYRKAFELFKQKGYNTTRLRRENIVTQSALTAMRKNAHINTRTVERLCAALDCQPRDLMEYVPDGPDALSDAKPHAGARG